MLLIRQRGNPPPGGGANETPHLSNDRHTFNERRTRHKITMIYPEVIPLHLATVCSGQAQVPPALSPLEMLFGRSLFGASINVISLITGNWALRQTGLREAPTVCAVGIY